MAIGVRVNATDDERVLVLHAVHDVLSIRKGGPVGKGGQNSDQALVANGFLSGHAARPDRPYGRSTAAGPQPTGPPKTPAGAVCAQVRPGPTARGNLHCLCDTHGGKRA